MLEKLEVNVNQEDIDFGEPESPTTCPIARAIKRQYKIPYASVGLFLIFVEFPVGKCLKYNTPLEMVRFIKNFDKIGKHAVVPFTQTIEALK